jgi:lipopolysaccharide biosynthesis protein
MRHIEHPFAAEFKPGSSPSRVRLLAVHLPQFHPTVENDAWWGKGFTEWTNVTKARRLFPGHYQPHLPAELGFYDLRLPEAREAQAALARAHGVHGFIYYHYWFHGKRLLDRPVEEILRSGKPDFPFCFCWANEPWTRSWTSNGSHVLMPQTYDRQDDREHIRWLLPAFADRRYLKVDGKPVFFIYRISQFPEPQRTLDSWREEALKFGLPGIYVIRFERRHEEGDPALFGADAAAEFQPDIRCLGPQLPRSLPMQTLRRLRLVPPPLRSLIVHSYDELVKHSLGRPAPPYKYYRCVSPGWDNTPRRSAHAGAWMTLGNTPDAYRRWLSGVLEQFQPYSADENFVLVNAWNEWAEGNHLEPCQRWGRAFLEATRSASAAASAGF